MTLLRKTTLTFVHTQWQLYKLWQAYSYDGNPPVMFAKYGRSAAAAAARLVFLPSDLWNEVHLYQHYAKPLFLRKPWRKGDKCHPKEFTEIGVCPAAVDLSSISMFHMNKQVILTSNCDQSVEIYPIFANVAEAVLATTAATSNSWKAVSHSLWCQCV